MKYINVYLNKRGFWAASLCRGTQEIDSIGGSYPKSNSASLDAQSKWGRDLEVKTSYGPMFISNELKERIVSLINEGATTQDIADRFNIKQSNIKAIKAHTTRGTYFDKYKGSV